MKVKEVALFGGIGNKLFQIAHGEWLRRMGFSVVFVDFSYKSSFLVYKALRWTKHEDWLTLQNVFNHDKFLLPSFMQQVIFIIEFILLRLQRKEGSIFKFDIGYFQNVNSNNSETIAWTADKLKKSINNKNNLNKAIIHFRGKDFTKNHKRYQLEIIKKVINKEKEINFYLISDDPNAFQKEFIDHQIENLSSSQMNDFIRIMNAENLILSDSTFAFWAFVVGYSPNKKYFIGKKNLNLVDAFVKNADIEVL